MPTLFEIQPLICRQPLELRKLTTRSKKADLIRRIVAYDPQPAYDRIALTANPLKRIQVRTNMSLEQLFPKKKNMTCDCGCGAKLTGRRRRWATNDCSEFAWYVYAIIAGRRYEIAKCLRAYYGRKCISCNKAPERVQGRAGRLRTGLEFDHIIPVHKGGGACWLSNYRPLCVKCHKHKTVSDRRNYPRRNIAVHNWVD